MFRLFKWALIAPLIALLAACSAGGGADPTDLSAARTTVPTLMPQPTLTPTPLATATPAATATLAATPTLGPTPEGGYTYLDSCTLLTADEATTILGEPAAPDDSAIYRQIGACGYRSASEAKRVYVSASYGFEARLVLLGLVSILTSISEDPALDAYAANLSATEATLSLLALFQDINTNMPPFEPPEPTDMRSSVALGDAAYYTWDASRSTAQLSVISGYKVVILSAVGVTPESAQAALEAQAAQVLARLPEGFTTRAAPQQ